MTDDEFALGVDRIIATKKGHDAHRSLDMLWTRYAVAKGGRIAEATLKWMDAIEGMHAPELDYVQPSPASRSAERWTTGEMRDAKAMRQNGLTWPQIGVALGRNGNGVRKRLAKAKLLAAPTPA